MQTRLEDLLKAMTRARVGYIAAVASVTPDPKAIRAFETPAALEAWLAKNHDKKSELYLRIYKKGANVPSVTYSEALDVALCWGWIDGLKKSYDEQSFLQRFTPRKARSKWSELNCQRVERLCQAGRMTPHGQSHVDAAKADGRWEAAYASPSRMQVPADLMAAIESNRAALATFRTLNKVNVYALAYRTHHVKTPAKRAERIRSFVAMLARGETLHPQSAAKSPPKPARTPKKTARAQRG